MAALKYGKDAVTIEQSCGVAEIDEHYRVQLLANAKMRPVIKDGKPVASVTTFSINLVQ